MSFAIDGVFAALAPWTPVIRVIHWINIEDAALRLGTYEAESLVLNATSVGARTMIRRTRVVPHPVEVSRLQYVGPLFFLPYVCSSRYAHRKACGHACQQCSTSDHPVHLSITK